MDIVVSDEENSQNKKLTLNFCRKPSMIGSSIEEGKIKKIDFSYTTIFSPNPDENNKTIKKDIRALIDLNIGGVTAKLEKKIPNLLSSLQIGCR